MLYASHTRKRQWQGAGQTDVATSENDIRTKIMPSRGGELENGQEGLVIGNLFDPAAPSLLISIVSN